ncbi:MAG: hypothetical protein H6R14_197 [Proteobacteria bacterium]|nr:hypothetical protein [Pseudomonadota bacterium]
MKQRCSNGAIQYAITEKLKSLIVRNTKTTMRQRRPKKRGIGKRVT